MIQLVVIVWFGSALVAFFYPTGKKIAPVELSIERAFVSVSAGPLAVWLAHREMQRNIRSEKARRELDEEARAIAQVWNEKQEPKD